MRRSECVLCESAECRHLPASDQRDDDPFTIKVPQAPPPTPRRARRLGHDRMKRTETHERGGEDR